MESGSQHARSIVDLINEDDAQVLALFDRLDGERGPGHDVAHERMIGRICETLSIQRLAEEDVLYPALRAADEKLVFGFLLAGLGISMRIGEIRDPAKARALRDACVARLGETVRRNMVERAQVLLPFVRARLHQTQLVWLGDSYAQHKARLWSAAHSPQAPRSAGRADKGRKVIPMPLARRQRPGDEAHLQ